MLTLPTTRGPAAAQAAPMVALGSTLQLRCHRELPAFLFAALRLRRAFRDAPGAAELRLGAEPWARRFWTCSTWQDKGDLDGFVRSAPHARVMRRFAGRLASTVFAQWPVEDAPSWVEVAAMLDATDRGVGEGLVR